MERSTEETVGEQKPTETVPEPIPQMESQAPEEKSVVEGQDASTNSPKQDDKEEPPNENEVSPHLVSDGIVPISDVKEGHLEDNTFGDDEDPEIKIDLTKIEFDKDGVPILTALDKQRIVRSGFGSPSFTIEVSTATESIKRCNKELNEENQIKDENLYNERIKILEDEIVNHHEDTDEKDLKAKEEEIVTLKEIIASLPKNNEQSKAILEDEKKSSIELLATYQHIARETIDELLKNGSLLALVSNTATGAFATSFVDEYMKYNNLKFEDDQLYVDLQKEYEETQAKSQPVFQKYFALNSVNDVFVWKEPEKKDIDDTIPEEEKQEEIVAPKIRDASKEDKTNIEAWKKLVATMLPLEKFDHLDKFETDLFYNEVTEKIKNAKVEYDVYEAKINELEIAINKQKENITGFIKDQIKTQGLTVNMLQYAMFAESTRTENGRNINFINQKYLDTIVEKFYFLIKLLVNKNMDQEFQIIKQNINSISMVQNNFIHYFESLYDEKIDSEWAENFDPQSILKFYYFDNEVFFKNLIKAYREQKARIYMMIQNNPYFIKQYENLARSCMFYIEEFNKRVQNKNIKIKDQYRKYLTVAFYDQILQGLKNYVTKIVGEEKDGVHIDATPEQLEDATRPIFSTLLHNITGFNLIAAFIHFKDTFAQNYSNIAFGEDCVKYIFHEFSLALRILKGLKKDENPMDFLKRDLRNISFQSTTFEFEKHINIEESRKKTFEFIFANTTAILKDIADLYDELVERLRKQAEEVPEVQTEVKHKPKKLTQQELDRKKKEKKRQAKIKSRYRDNIYLLSNWYEALLEQRLPTQTITNTIYWTKSPIGLLMYTFLEKTQTSCKIKINCYKKPVNCGYNQIENVINASSVRGKNYEAAVAQNTVRSLLENMFTRSYNYLEDTSYKNINNKWYFNEVINYNQFIKDDGSIEDDTNIIETKLIKQMLSIFAKDTDNKSIWNNLEKEIVEYLETTVDTTKKVGVRFKDNGRVFVKKYDYHLDNKSDKDILNFYDGADELWSSIIVDLKYDRVLDDIAPEKEVITQKHEEKKPIEQKNTRPQLKQVNQQTKTIPINPKTGRPFTRLEMQQKQMLDRKNGKVTNYVENGSIIERGVSTQIRRPGK